jgi:DNA adenine methylase
MAGPKLSAIAPWFGGKRTLAPAIVAELGPHRAYWEPFLGGCAILFAKETASAETVNDLHGDLTNLARCLANEAQAASLYRRCSGALFCERLFDESVARIVEPFVAGVERAFDYLVVCWMGRNGTAGTGAFNHQLAVRWTHAGGTPSVRWRGVGDSIPQWHERLRRVTILNRDGFEVLERIEDSPQTAIYCDPPYLVKGEAYLHDFAGDDHWRLADLLKRFRQARVVVSYYEDARLAEMYAGWHVRRLCATKNIANVQHRGTEKVAAPEVLLMNGPSLAAGAETVVLAADGAGRGLFA